MQLQTSSTEQRQVYTVSALNRKVRQLLETHLAIIWVEGELTNLAQPASGHWYFTLKNSGAQVRCALFRQRGRNVTLRPADGMQVLVRGRVGLYENRGDYQLIVEHIEQAGHGALQRQFDALKNKLALEGLFAAERKRALPLFPRRIGVVTSASGAALQDVLHVLQRRFPVIPVVVYPTAVQGAAAAAQIIAALDLANQHQRCGVIILCRGGGSLEDLWSFNEEAVARAVAASAIPIIAGVGHETDTTIVDFVADARAPTPSTAAELATPDGAELYATISGYARWFAQQAQQHLQRARQQVHWLGKRLRHPRDHLAARAQHLDHLEIRLANVITASLRRKRADLRQGGDALQAQRPEHRLHQLQVRFTHTHDNLKRAVQRTLTHRRQQLANMSNLLQAVSPLHTLERGYAIVQDSGQQVVSHIAQAQTGNHLTITVVDGSLDCVVAQIHHQSRKRER